MIDTPNGGGTDESRARVTVTKDQDLGIYVPSAA
jgi:hypothetical protein